MNETSRESILSPLPSGRRSTNPLSATSQIFFDETISSPLGSTIDHTHNEEYRRHLLDEEMINAEERGFCVCRLWQFLLTLNLTIFVTTVVLVLLLLFIIGPLAPYQTYSQSCRTLSCNAAQGLACNDKSICSCPSSDSYWSWNKTSCRRCPTEWTIINGKCIFISTFLSNWSQALSYCQSYNGQLLTFSSSRLYSQLTFSQLNSSVSSTMNYFLGLSEEPLNSGQWQWVDGNSLGSNSMNLFCSNGLINEFDPFFQTYMNCGIFRMDRCLARYTCQRADISFMCEKI